MKPIRKAEKALVIAGLREHHQGSNATIPAQWQRFGPHIGKVPGQMGRVAYGVVIDAAAGFDYLTGVSVASTADLPAGFAHVTLPAQSYDVFTHQGHVSTLFETITKALAQLPGEHGAGSHPGQVGFLERYGEEFDPATGFGDIELWFPLARNK